MESQQVSYKCLIESSVAIQKYVGFQHIVVLFSIRSQPINTFEWGKDTAISVRFNPAEPNVLATSARSAVFMK